MTDAITCKQCKKAFCRHRDRDIHQSRCNGLPKDTFYESGMIDRRLLDE